MVKQKKILLVNPACQDERISGDDAKFVPIGVYYIAAQLLDNGYPTAILNLADIKDEDPLTCFTRVIETQKPDIIGFDACPELDYIVTGEGEIPW